MPLSSPTLLHRFKHFVGIPNTGHHTSEQLLATVGGALCVALIIVITRHFLPEGQGIFIIPSMAATALLVFAAPHSVFAQPWAVLAGHLLSAVIGVACYRLLPHPVVASTAAVGLSIGIMHLMRCIHPPGSATALGAVIGSSSVHDLGFGYALFPVGINCAVILLAGYLFNAPFAWRRYPASLTRYRASIQPMAPGLPDEADIEAAMDRLNLVIDTTPEEILEILKQAIAAKQGQTPPRLEVGRYYANDRPGKEWSVRQIIDERPSENPEFDLVVFRTVEGAGTERANSCTRQEFMAWMASECSPGGR